MSVRVYKFGLLPPSSGRDVILKQMRKAHIFYNDLIAVEGARRDRVRSDGLYERVSSFEKAFLAADAEVERLAKEIKTARAQTRSRSEKDETRDQLALARLEKKAARKSLAEARSALRADQAHALLEAETKELAGQLCRDAYALAGPGSASGTKTLVKSAVEQAKGTTPYFDGVTPVNPRFRRWQGEGAIGIDSGVKGGMSESHIHGKSSQICIADVNPAAWDSATPRGERRRLSRTTLKMRLDWAEDEKSIVWGEWPMIMHRPLPDGCKISKAAVHLRKIGSREEWSLTLTCSMRDAVPGDTAGVVAIDVGWRKMGSSTRVASWADNQGNKSDFRLSADILEGKQRRRLSRWEGREAPALNTPDSLQAQRDKGFDSARGSLSAWLLGRTDIPAWLGAATETLGSWRSPARLASLVRRWRDNRFVGDETIYAETEAWRYHDYHLWQWEASLSKKTLRRRKEEYRIFAARLVSTYGTIVLEDFDLSRVARKPVTGEAWSNQHANANRHSVAISELREAIRNVASRTGARVVVVPAALSTHTCHACGVIDDFDAMCVIKHTCSGCGAEWDQDENAAIVLLQRYQEGVKTAEEAPARDDEEPQDVEEIKETPRQRQMRMYKARVARLAAARETADKAAE